MENYTDYFVPIVMIGCLILGYILKKWVEDLENKYIPTILASIGLIMNVLINGFTVESAVYGALTGLASTGLHQAFSLFINKEGESENG